MPAVEVKSIQIGIKESISVDEYVRKEYSIDPIAVSVEINDELIPFVDYKVKFVKAGDKIRLIKPNVYDYLNE